MPAGARRAPRPVQANGGCMLLEIQYSNRIEEGLTRV